MNKRRIKRNFDEQLTVVSAIDQTKLNKKRNWHCTSETKHRGETRRQDSSLEVGNWRCTSETKHRGETRRQDSSLEVGNWRCTSETKHRGETRRQDFSLEVDGAAVHPSKHANFNKRGSPPTNRHWRYNRVWCRDRVWTRKDTPRQNEALLSIKNTDKHQTEKCRDREYVQDRRHYKIWHKNKQQNHRYHRDPREVKVFLEQSSQLVKFKDGKPPTVRNWRYNRVWRRDKVWTKEETIQQRGTFSTTKLETPKSEKSRQQSKSPTFPVTSFLTSPNSSVDLSKKDMGAASRCPDTNESTPSVTMSPTHTRSMPPSEDLLSVATVDKSQTTVVCSGKETASTLNGSSSYPIDKVVQHPIDKVVQPTETTEAQQACRETKPSDEKMVRKSHKRKRPSVRNTPNKRFMFRAPADDTEEASIGTHYLWSFETEVEQLCLAYEDLCLS